MSKFSTLCLGAAALVASACNPYDPNLPTEPFRCGTEEPRCPDGYKCDIRSETEQICVPENSEIPSDRPDASVPEPDAMAFVCNDDSQIDNNNTIGTATQTPIPALSDDYELVGLSICPTTDVDIYTFRIDMSGKNLVVDVEYESSRGALLLDILNSSGLTITEGAILDGNPNVIRAAINDMAADIYYAQVSATPGAENNYSIHISTSGP